MDKDKARRYVVQVRLSDDERRMLKALAARNGLSRSDVIRRMITHHHGLQAKKN